MTEAALLVLASIQMTRVAYLPMLFWNKHVHLLDRSGIEKRRLPMRDDAAAFVAAGGGGGSDDGAATHNALN